MPGHPVTRLPAEDLDLVAELVLCSGSLKDLAAAYGVSYPTIRLRLDRTIERLRALVKGRPPDPLSEVLGALVERGELTASGARAIGDVVRKAGGGSGKHRGAGQDGPVRSADLLRRAGRGRPRKASVAQGRSLGKAIPPIRNTNGTKGAAS